MAPATESSGPYVLVSRLGEGGMAEVFKAYKQGPDGWKKPIALKRILPKYADHGEFVRMLSAEARLHAHLEHPNIVQILDFFRHGQSFVMALEYVPGKNLRTVVSDSTRTRKPLPWQAAVHIISEILRGLDYSHKRRGPDGPLGIVHRDVSPQNILISYHGLVKLSDFGIALADIDRDQTLSGVLKGKHRYLAPEQIEHRATDFRADLFSTSVVLYELLTGTPPFTGENEFQVMKNIAKGECKKLDAEALSIPNAIVDAVHQAMEHDPKLRPIDAHTFRQALHSVQEKAWLSSGAEQLEKLMLGLYPLPKDREEAILEKTAVMTGGKSPLPSEIVPQESLIFSTTDLATSPSKSNLPRKLSRTRFILLAGTLLGAGAIWTFNFRQISENPSLPTKKSALTLPTELSTANSKELRTPTPTATFASPSRTSKDRPTRKTASPSDHSFGHLTVIGPAGALLYVNGRVVGKLPKAGRLRNLKSGEYLFSIKPEKGAIINARGKVIAGKENVLRVSR